MICDRKDLHFYIHEDAWRNDIKYITILDRLKYLIKVVAGCENACAFRYLKCLRHMEFHLNNSPKIYHKLFYYYYKFKIKRLGIRYKIQIMPNICGYGIRLLHLSGGGGILLNAKKIGNYCGFNAGVMLGNVGNQENRVTVGDYVAFGPGAKAFGKINIGNNVFVAPNAVVTKDVPSNCIIGGISAKYIKKYESPILKKIDNDK